MGFEKQFVTGGLSPCMTSMPKWCHQTGLENPWENEKIIEQPQENHGKIEVYPLLLIKHGWLENPH